ncbi:hypothetical protein GCM10025859_15130 [Alicyclobacillus fastidiosus]|nr:hypothetical protein GCM10025859_15130 [Alicyclobacillus fastidiosus]
MCSTMPRSDMIMEVEEDEEPGLQLFPVRDFSGEVVSNERVTPDSADVVSGSGPFGRMQLRSLDNDIVFVAGGSGLAPIKALLESAFAQGFTRQAWLFYGARTTKDLYLTEHWFDWETRSS